MNTVSHPQNASTEWLRSRDRVRDYFRAGAERWTRLTGDEEVSRIRATVRAGREEMRNTLVSWLPEDVAGMRILDAGCGPGVLSWELAARGADVVGVDLAPELIEAAETRGPAGASARPDFRTGDLFEVAREGFDAVIAMDCFIHYTLDETVEAMRAMEKSVDYGVLFTVAPWTPLLGAMHLAGKLFPRKDRAPAIIPVKDRALRDRLDGPFGPTRFGVHRSHTVHRGFYISRAIELTRRGHGAWSAA